MNNTVRYLITGIAGFVGSSLARAIIQNTKNAEIVGIDNLSYGYIERIADIDDDIELIIGDLLNIKKLIGKIKFDIIIHCAAIAPLPECQRDSYMAISQNVAICGTVVDYALYSGSRNIIFFSSGAVYESTTTFPTHENIDIETSLVYPTTKFMAELYFSAMCRSYGINVTAIRLFNLYGPYQDYFRKQPPLIGYLLSCLILDREAQLYSSGEQSRDYVYINDLLDLINQCVNKMVNRSDFGEFCVVNAASGVSISVNDIIGMLENISGKALQVKRFPSENYWDKYKDLFDTCIPLKHEIISNEVNKYTNGSTHKAFNEFGWAAKTQMIDGLKCCYDMAKEIIC